ncbi:MAG: sigma 54-interacting transcriptional regulator [Moorella humiferrea]|nr:sigma 54-interacting transcriptional regulator [Moorella humiferrea]
MAAITMVATYQSLAEMAMAICQENKWEVDIVVGQLEQGVELARAAVKGGSRVIISRGLTARYIRNALEVPVVSVPVTGYDLLRAYWQARQEGTPVGVAEEEEVIMGFNAIGEILGEKIMGVAVKDIKGMRRAIRYLKREGAKVFVGKGTATRLAQAYSLKAVMITSGWEGVLQALEEAWRVLKIYEQEQAKIQQMKAIVDFNSDAIIAVDENMVITTFNPAAERLLGRSRDEVIGVPITQIFSWPFLDRIRRTGREEKGVLMPLEERQVVINGIPIKVENRIRGLIITLQDVQQIQKLEHKIRRNLVNRGHIARYTFDDILGESMAIRDAIRRAMKFAPADAIVLLQAETGCGKEMFAQAIHRASRRKDGPFVAVNCAALPENLLESELFGYAEGAFTGARRGGKPGLFEIAHGGTIFLDEIGEMSGQLQARVLRVLEEGQVMRLGDDRLLPVDVRVIAATNRNLKQMVQEGRFRADLYYRLHVLTLNIPPLRARGEDIIILFYSFLHDFCIKFQKEIPAVEEQALNLLRQYTWPGNVRELKNMVERLVLLADKSAITAGLIKEMLEEESFSPSGIADLGGESQNLLDKTVWALIERVLAATGGNQAEAARRLGIGRTTLWRKLNKYRKTGQGTG